MFSKENRLQKKSDIDLVFKKGKSLRDGLIILKILKTNLRHPRFAFVISHKVSNKAAVRNKLRRRLKSLLSESFKGSSSDFLLIALPGLEKREFGELRETVERLFKRING